MLSAQRVKTESAIIQKYLYSNTSILGYFWHSLLNSKTRVCSIGFFYLVPKSYFCLSRSKSFTALLISPLLYITFYPEWIKHPDEWDKVLYLGCTVDVASPLMLLWLNDDGQYHEAEQTLCFVFHAVPWV